MNNPITQVTSFNERIIIKRIFFKECKSLEALSVFVMMMNDYPIMNSKKDVYQLAGGKLLFSCYHYNDGFIFEGRLLQCQSKALKFIFSNPYKEAERIFSNIMNEGVIHDEKALAFCKDKISKMSEFSSSSLLYGIKSLSFPYSDVLIDKNKLIEVTLDDIDDVFLSIKSSDLGDVFYIANDISQPLTLNCDLKQKPSLKYSLFDNIKQKRMDDESCFFFFAMKELKNIKDKKMYDLSISMLVKDIKDELSNKVFLDYKIDSFLLDNSHFAISITCENNKLNSILQYLDFTSLLLSDHYDYAINVNSMKTIKEKIDSSIVIDEIILNNDLGLTLNDDAIVKEDVLNYLATIKFERKIVFNEDKRDA